MPNKTFKGGIVIDEHKYTANKKIVAIAPPKYVSIPLSQHIGSHCTPAVSVGDRVLKGQLIGQAGAGLGCPVHSSVSGIVTAIETKINQMGTPVVHITIENDGKNEYSPEVRPCGKKLNQLSAEAIIDMVRDAGISGMGGATFPTYAKIQSALGKVEYLIINCAECEPYITANHRLILEHAKEVLGGAKILLWCLGLRRAAVAIENNKPDAVKLLKQLTENDKLIDLEVMKTKYPQGDERQLIFALTGRQIPEGGLPADVGCVVFNAETAFAVYNAVVNGIPLIERVVTVDGNCVKNPSNLLVPIGTPLSALIEFCGGLTAEAGKIISGGPMMGIAQFDPDSPVTKGISAVLAFSEKSIAPTEVDPCCIRCGKCVRACQMHLLPNYIALFARKGDFDACEKYDAMSCVECGCCSYVCPAKIEITQLARLAKAKINEKRRAGGKK